MNIRKKTFLPKKAYPDQTVFVSVFVSVFEKLLGILLISGLLGGGFLSCHYPFNLVTTETLCSDGQDNDRDGLTDCDDPDCADEKACEPVETNCQDNVDNDEDGLTDCADDDCENQEICEPSESLCSDEIDNDGDGLTDCADSDCQNQEICNTPQPCDDDGICESFESPFWCEDCCPECSLNEGQQYNYIAYEVIIPSNVEEAQIIGVDIDGDDIVDNGFGAILGQFPEDSGGTINEDLEEAVSKGQFILLGRLYVSRWPDDEHVVAQIFQGSSTYDATEDNLTGSGHTLIAPTVDRSKYICGEIKEGKLDSCPNEIIFPLYLADTVLQLPLHKARMVSQGEITDATWVEMMVGGGVDQQAIDDHLLPLLLIHLNRNTLEDPASTMGSFVLTMVDGLCNSELPGCQEVESGQGECSPWSGDPEKNPLTITELKCNTFIQQLLEKDVDSDGDGVNDLLSFGVCINAIKVYIDN